MWAGVVGSVLTWTWAWYVGHGAQVVMVLFALAAVALAYRASMGMRVALAGLILVGFVMFLASLYWMFLVMMPTTGANGLETASLSLFPMVTSVMLLLGSAVGFRHTK
jgi:hypothetical protein